MNPERSHTYGNKSLIIVFFVALFISFLISSCVSQRNLEYLQNEKNLHGPYNEAEYADYHLKPNDALYIKIRSLDDATSNVFAQSAEERTLDPYGAYMNSYLVDNEGYVQLQVIGRIYVSGKTTTQVGELIKDSLINVLSLPMVTVKLVNRYVSVLGEVRNPGHFVYSQDKFTIYNALGLAGDISAYGNRRDVILTRNENGKNTVIRLDLTRQDILSSPYYYVQPNDFIYVKPMKKRIWGMEQFPFSIIFSTITTGLLIYTIIQQQ